MKIKKGKLKEVVTSIEKRFNAKIRISSIRNADSNRMLSEIGKFIDVIDGFDYDLLDLGESTIYIDYVSPITGYEFKMNMRLRPFREPSFQEDIEHMIIGKELRYYRNQYNEMLDLIF